MLRGSDINLMKFGHGLVKTDNKIHTLAALTI